MNAHRILKVNKDATQAEIKSAYRKMAAKYHPDQGGDAWIFQQIQDAYDELTGKKPKSPPKSEHSPKQPSGQAADDFGFETPRYTGTKRGFQSSSRSKSKKKSDDKTWLWILGSIASVVVIVTLAIGGWFLVGRLLQPAAKTGEDSVAHRDHTVEHKEATNDEDVPEAKTESSALAQARPIEESIPKAGSSTATQSFAAAEALPERVAKPETLLGKQNTKPSATTSMPKANAEEVAKEPEFVALFNGKNFEGWQGVTSAYSIRNNAIVFDPKGKVVRDNLSTSKTYSNFILKFEFQLSRGANNGLAIHYSGQGDPAFTGKEIQILDNSSPKYKKVPSKSIHGSVWSVLPAKRGFLKPVGQWNEQTVEVDGSKIKVTLNGSVVVDGDVSSVPNRASNGKPRPGLRRSSGFIGFAGHTGRVKFRNIFIKEQ